MYSRNVHRNRGQYPITAASDSRNFDEDLVFDQVHELLEDAIDDVMLKMQDILLIESENVSDLDAYYLDKAIGSLSLTLTEILEHQFEWSV